MGSPASSPTAPPSEILDLRPAGRQRSFATSRVVLALMLREMATTYGRSPGGYLWAVLEPAAGIALLSIIFSLGFRHPPMGTNFPIFYATGLLPYLLYVDVSRKLAASLGYSRQLLVYPSVTFIDALIARLVLNVLTQLLVAYIVLTGILVGFETRTSVDLPTIALGFAMAAALAAGVGTANCFLFRVFPTWERFWKIVTRPLLFVSGIIFLYDAVPEPYQGWLWYNPLIHVVGQMRHGFYPYYHAQYVSVLYVFGFSLVLCVFGLIFLRRYHREILNS